MSDLPPQDVPPQDVPPKDVPVKDVPPKERWFEDYRVGEVFEFGDCLITREEIVEFAAKYDPQPFHLDDEAGRATIYGGLIASGWMTCGVLMRMLVDEFIPPRASMGSPGVDTVRWLKPVRPGDRLRTRVEIVETRRSQSKPDRGVVRFEQQLFNQHGERVLTLRGMSMYRTRPADAAAG